jgi:tetratricopeptide (TPR) repeat protein
MPTSPLLATPQKTPAKRLLRVPLILLALLALALYAEVKWSQSRMLGSVLMFHQTPSGWQKLPLPKGYPESLRVSSGGTVWSLTWGRAGLSRWDGTAWQYFKATDFGSPTSYVDREFALDGEQVWAATEESVLHWDGQKWHSDPSASAGYDASIAAGGGEVWMIDHSGKLSHYAKGKWQSQKLALPGVIWSDKPGGAHPRLARSDDGALWLAAQGLWRWDGANWTKVTNPGEVQLLGAAADRFWFADSQGLRSGSTDGKNWALYPTEQTGLDDEADVYEVASAGGRTWFATEKGVLEFDGSNWRMLPLPGGGTPSIRRVAAGPDGSLWFMGSTAAGSAKSLRYVLYLTSFTPLAILGVIGWIAWRFRKRQYEQHQRVTQAVQHATGEVPEELEAGAGRLKPGGFFGNAFLWIGTIVGYIILRMFWPKAPWWTIAVIGVLMHLAITFQESLVKRRPKPYDPIGPGAPSRYDWAKSWKAAAGTLAVILLINIDRLPMLRFLRGYWFWLIVLVPVVYQTLSVHLLNRAAKRGDYDRALNIIRWFNFYNPSGMEPLRMSGHMLLMAGRYQEAENTLRRSLASSHARESYGFALEYLGDALMEQRRYDEATRSYEAALLAFAWRRRPYRGLAEMQLRRGENPVQALEYVEKIRDFADLSWREKQGNGKSEDDYWALKAWALAQVGKTSEVAEAIENALKHTDKLALPDMATTHYRVGMAMQTMGNETAAREHFKLAEQFDPHGRRGALAKAAMRETHVWGGAVKV